MVHPVKSDEDTNVLFRGVLFGRNSSPTDNQIYGLPANHFSPSAGTTLLKDASLG